MSERDLHDGVRARRVTIGCILRSNPEAAAELNDLQELIGAADHALLQTDDMDVLLVVLPDLQLGARVQQIVQPAAVDLVETDTHMQMPELRLNPHKITCSISLKISRAPR